MRKVLFFLLLLTIGQRMLAQTPAFITDSLDGYIRQGLKDWNVPGLAVVIVKDGKIAYIKGFGVQDTISRLPVDENTLFMIASNTKLFTATMLSQLEYDKKISLDDKFTKYFPDFKLYEPTTSELLTIRDLLSHRIGTKTFQGDFTFWNSKLNTEEIMKRMKLLKPEAGFRSHFGYCNSCFMAAGQVITKVTRQSWQEYVKDSILTPLGMTHTYTSTYSVLDVSARTWFDVYERLHDLEVLDDYLADDLIILGTLALRIEKRRDCGACQLRWPTQSQPADSQNSGRR